ncbi:MAG: hypothetical protein NTW21_27960 [Verrucomicrobia bacterium]|nr:hypothetical protein [Verrucomicrobiota bacterium]
MRKKLTMRKTITTLILAGLAATGVQKTAAAAGADMLMADFEGPDYGAWKVESSKTGT